MGDVFGKPAIVTDTHCIRLVNRMGLVDGVKDPKKVEMALWKIIPPEEGSDLCHRLVYHGEGMYAVPVRSHIVMCAVYRTFAKNVVFRRRHLEWENTHHRQEAIDGSQI